jgi:hypothetical protein
MVILAVISGVIADMIPIHRLSCCLRNNETDDACMLIAAHENVIGMALSIKDRAVVDTLLNKPMFVLPYDRMTRIAEERIQLRSN